MMRAAESLIHRSVLLSDYACFIQDRAMTQVDLVKLAFALAAHKTDHGECPANLAPLCPRYIHEVPKDRFGGGDLKYQPGKDGYLLYSVGMNETDDGGSGGGFGEPPGDDISVRVPRAASRARTATNQ